MLNRLVRTNDDHALTIARLVLGALSLDRLLARLRGSVPVEMDRLPVLTP